MGKKIILQPFVDIPTFAAKVCALNFFQDEFTPWRTHFWVFLTSKMDSQT